MDGQDQPQQPGEQPLWQPPPPLGIEQPLWQPPPPRGLEQPPGVPQPPRLPQPPQVPTSMPAQPSPAYPLHQQPVDVPGSVATAAPLAAEHLGAPPRTPEHVPKEPELIAPEVVVGVTPEGKKLVERRSHRTLWGYLMGVGFFVFLLGWPYWSYFLLPSGGRSFVQAMLAALILGIAAIGLNIVAGYTGMLSLGHAGFLAVGAFTMVGVSSVVSPWLAVPVALVAGAVSGVVVAIFCVHLKGFYLSVVTFLFGILLTTLLGNLVGALKPETRLSGLYPDPDAIDLGFAPTEAFQVRFYYFVVVILMLVLAGSYYLIQSGLGRAWKAIRDSDIAARASGIPLRRFRVLSFAVSAALAALAGVLFSQNPNNSVVSTESFGFQVSFFLVFYIVFGGLGTISGPVVGSLALGTFAVLGFQEFKLDQTGAVGIIYGVLVVILVVLAPNGAVGMLRDLRRRVDADAVKRGRPPRRPAAPRITAEDRAPRPTRQPGLVSQAPLLDLRSASKIFGGLRAVDSLDMQIWPGTIHSLIGPNGSGKTTTINVITGFYKADEGRVFFTGKDVTTEASHRRAHRGMTRTFQNLQVWRDMTVLENVMVGMQPKLSMSRSLFGRKQDAAAKQRSGGLLDYVRLTDKASDDAGTLALADLRRLEIARALAADPDLLLLDEPAAGMNPAEANELTDLIRDINDHGVTVLLIEHHMDVVMELSDRITVLDYGQKISEGTPQEVQNDPRVIEAYLGAEA